MASKATNHFIMQRLTAMIQVPLVLWLAFSLALHAGDSHAEFMAWLSRPLTAALLIVFLLSIAYHFRLGLGEIVDDYVHKASALKLSQGLVQLYALAIAAIAVFSVIAITLIA
jgi:succinate dehydrogenase / fumarate reductase membrane anchor subunit